MRNNRMYHSKTGRKLLAAFCAASLTAGLFLPVLVQKPLIKAVRAEETAVKTKEQLSTGPYVEGEALVLTADSDTMTFTARGDDLLSKADEVFSIDSGIENPMQTYSAFKAADGESEPEQVKGTIKLVKSSILSTEQLIEALYENPRVIYAEPNYILTSSDDKNEIPGTAGEQTDKDAVKDETNGKEETSDKKENQDKKDNQAQKDESDSKEESSKKEDPASDSKETVQTKKQEEQTSEKSETKAAENEDLTPSNFGPSDFTSGQIPDMTQWQWSNYNNGRLAGTYTHEGTADTQYEAWKTQTKESESDYVIAVLDTGIDETNPDLAGVLWTGDAFMPGGDSHGYYVAPSTGANSTSGLGSGHGTHVAGIIASEWNGQGTSGVSSNVKLMSLRFNETFVSAFLCLQYAKEAVRNGVNLIAVNNSWCFGLNTSNLINTAVTELGQMGVVSLFASGNESSNLDQSISTPTTLANNPYAVVVDSIGPSGANADYSNYGIGTTDVMAPGSLLLSTLPNKPEQLNFMGEINAHAQEGSVARNNLVSYSSFDEESVNPFESFAVYSEKDGTAYGFDLQYPVQKPAVGAFDGTGVLSIRTNEEGRAGIITSPVNLSALETKPHYVSFRIIADQPDIAAYSPQIAVPVFYAYNNGRTEKAFKIIENQKMFGGHSGNYRGLEFDLSQAEVLTEKEQTEGICGSYINWAEFSLTLYAVCYRGENKVPGTICFDSIALGSVRYPYGYADGTSMACPAATGVLSVIAGQNADFLGPARTSDFAEKLAALVKGSAVTVPDYEGYCATSGYVSVAGAQNPGPAITSVTDGTDSFTVTGYFMDNPSISVDSINCSYALESKENDKFTLKVQKPASYKGSFSVVTVRGANGKMDRSLASLSDASGQTSAVLYDHTNIEVPAEIAEWTNYDLTGYNGKIYIFPRSFLDDCWTSSHSIFAYDPQNGSWDKIEIPVESLTLDGERLLTAVTDITACAKDGKLYLLISGFHDDKGGRIAVLTAMDQNAEFEILGCQEVYTSLPAMGTMAYDGTDLYLAGGIVQTNPETKSCSSVTAICKLTVDAEKKIIPEVVANMTSPRVIPRVSVQKNTMVISGGCPGAVSIPPVSTPAGGADLVTVGGQTAAIDVKSVLNDPSRLSFSSGALADGTYILAGPLSKDGTADTYILNQDLSLNEYDKRAWSANIHAPASIAYNNAFYVLAQIAPSGEGQPSLVFSSTAVKAGIPDGDTLVRTIKSAPAKTGAGVPELKNTDICVTQNDLVSNLKDQTQKVIDRINQSDKDSEVYLEANKLAENNVPQAEKEAILTAASQEKMKDNLFWMDLAMYLQIPEQDRIKLDTNEAGTKVAIKLPDFPELQKGYSRSYKIFAYSPDGEDGKKAEVITPEFDAQNQTLTFNWKTSSVYAIGYADTKDP
ncbi:MAG: S8 family serine peptidase, partial [Erysipelotrichaceae bacterium]|nr:S8 family serine peptidase [Erysipelotrichaceae bacterium]